MSALQSVVRITLPVSNSFLSKTRLFPPSTLLMAAWPPIMRHFSSSGDDDLNHISKKNPATTKLISYFEHGPVGSYKDDLLAISNSIRNSSIRVQIHNNLVTYYKSRLDELTLTLFKHSKLAHKNVVKKINQFTIPLSFIYHSNNLQFEAKNYLFKHFNETL